MKEETDQMKHLRCIKQYPDVDLEDDEYVVLHMRRSPLGLVAIWSVVALCIFVLSISIIAISNNIKTAMPSFLNETAMGYLWLLVMMLYIVIIMGGIIGQVIYNSNSMYVTNMRAIQKIRTSLFNNSTNVIELKRIEDVSFHQNGIIDHLFRMGVLRMSTVGSETTYTFPFLDTPKDEVETISKLVHNTKAV